MITPSPLDFPLIVFQTLLPVPESEFEQSVYIYKFNILHSGERLRQFQHLKFNAYNISTEFAYDLDLHDQN